MEAVMPSNLMRILARIAVAVAMAGINIGAGATAAELKPAAEPAVLITPDGIIGGSESSFLNADPRLSDRQQLRRYFIK
jgi:hypothetical protein